MPADNLFSAIPTAGYTGASTDDIVSIGGQVRTPLTATWPCRCVVCNREVPAADFHTKLVWYPRWTIIVFVISRLIGLILMMIKRKTADLHVGLCDEHKATRRTNMMIWGAVLGGSCLAIPIGAVADAGALAGFGFLGAVVGLIGLLVSMRTLGIAKVEGEYAYIKAKPAFVNSLPPAY